MKTTMCVLLILLVFILNACAPAGGGDSSKATPTLSESPIEGEDGSLPSDDGTDSVVVNPTPTPTPAPNPTPTPTPTPAPGNLSCFNNAGVFCTGGNLGPSLVQLNLIAMFTGGNPSLQVIVTSVQNNLNATRYAICSQPNGAGCASPSTCVSVSIVNPSNHTSYPYMLCGDVVNPNSRELN